MQQVLSELLKNRREVPQTPATMSDPRGSQLCVEFDNYRGVELDLDRKVCCPIQLFFPKLENPALTSYFNAILLVFTILKVCFVN